jgi:hypothetical protein
MSNSIAGPMLERLGQLIAEVMPDRDPEGAWMYAEAGDQWVEATIFQDEGEAVRCWFMSNQLADAILQLWDAQKEVGKEWAVLVYAINRGRFDARFEYPEDIDPEGDSLDRRAGALIERFGNKPVIYPKIDKDRFYQPTLDELTSPDEMEPDSV